MADGLWGTEAGLSGIRMMKAMAASKQDSVSTEGYIDAKGWAASSAMKDYIKAGVPTLTGSNTGLVQSDLGADFMQALRPRTIIGRLGLKRLPARTRLLTQRLPFRAYWVKEGAMIPASGGSYTAENLELLKVGAFTVVSNELLTAPGVDVERGMLDDLQAACAEAIDRAIIIPTNAGVAGEKPVAVTHPAQGGTLIPSTGSTIAALDTDMKAAAAALLAAGSDLSAAVWVLSPSLALKMSLLRGTNSTLAYPGLSVNGGVLAGLPVITTAGARDLDVEYMALLDPRQIGYVEGEPVLRTSTSAAVDLNSAPGDTGMKTPLSLFQAEATALLTFIATNFRARRPAAATITGVAL